MPTIRYARRWRPDEGMSGQAILSPDSYPLGIPGRRILRDVELEAFARRPANPEGIDYINPSPRNITGPCVRRI
jgi:hypothetical protein